MSWPPQAAACGARNREDGGTTGSSEQGHGTARPERTTPDVEARRRPDLVQRDFTASGRDELWVADLTYLRCWEGLVFFAFIIDVYSRRIVGLAVRQPHAHHARA